MKIGFWGTPRIASYCLEALRANHEIRFVVTPPDKYAGRNNRLTPPSAKQTALKWNIPVLQPEKLKDSSFIDKIAAFNADIFVVVAYGKLIPPEIFNHPPLKTINLHPSLLPKYRGAAPIPWVIINGEKETGITVQLINEKMDAGDIVLQKKIPLDDMISAEDLYNMVLPKGAALIDEAIKLLASGTHTPIKQSDDDATFCGKITRDTARINWNSPARSIHNLVRGLNPKPAAWTTFRGSDIKIFGTAVLEGAPELEKIPEAGEIIRYQKKRVIAGTSSLLLEILELQPEAKKRMNALSFINGYRLEGESRFI
ncbi:MAG: methionyl-tRNA formyltransferase [Spirochaetia bacterium]|jgi:methionyl-tRNA formyltransferase|nr:methionyl-tRNA formyltransferase [Spirochaetia bacterium]